MKRELFVRLALAFVLVGVATSACGPAATHPPPAQTPTPTQVVVQVATNTPEFVSEAEPTARQQPTASAPLIHTVRAGDTLSKIAQQYGVNVESIVLANSIPNPDLIEVGQRLVIPVPEESSRVAPMVTAVSVTPTRNPLEDKLHAALSLWGAAYDLRISQLVIENKAAIVEGTTENNLLDTYQDQYSLDSEVKALALDGVFWAFRGVDGLQVVTVRIVHKGKVYLETTATRTAAEALAKSITGATLTELVMVLPDGTAGSIDQRYFDMVLDDADRILGMFSTRNYIPRLDNH